MTGGQTFARATSEYDRSHERELIEAVTEAILIKSKVHDCAAIVVRTGEIQAALLTVMAGFIALSPALSHSPTATRRTVDAFSKRLRLKILSAKQCPDLRDFTRQAFTGGPEGHA